MVFRRSADEDDEITNTLIDRGVYRLSEVYEDEEIKKFKDLKVPYSFWSAVKYSFILTVLAVVASRFSARWWPVSLADEGPESPGRESWLRSYRSPSYSSSRSWLTKVTYQPSSSGVDWTPSHILDMVKDFIPLLAPYIVFVEMYLTSFIDTIQIATDIRVDVYIITAAFAYIGGILAEQSRLEMNYVAKHGGNSMTVVVGGGRDERPGRKLPEERPVRGKRPVSAKPIKTRQEQKVIRFGDLKDLTTANDEGLRPGVYGARGAVVRGGRGARRGSAPEHRGLGQEVLQRPRKGQESQARRLEVHLRSAE
ncbi:MAG: hypothetical protein MZV70_43695 [Desulfobacterales bacterium]|nr:hypothetical protein [Desulfobacterales bacterium]